MAAPPTEQGGHLEIEDSLPPKLRPGQGPRTRLALGCPIALGLLTGISGFLALAPAADGTAAAAKFAPGAAAALGSFVPPTLAGGGSFDAAGRPRPGRRAPALVAAQMQFGSFGLGSLFGRGAPEGRDESLEEAGVVPDILPETFEPKTVLRVRFPAWVKSAVDLRDVSSFGGTPTRGAGEIGMGQVITPTQAQSKPVVGWEPEKGAFYTLVLVDPDAPSAISPTLREWVHWVRVNVPGDNMPCDGEDGGDDLKKYIGALPPPDTGLHRYVFLLYKQGAGKQDFEDADRTPSVKDGRSGWNTTAFAEKYGLRGPVAWNYFRAQFDNYVIEYNNMAKDDAEES